MVICVGKLGGGVEGGAPISAVFRLAWRLSGAGQNSYGSFELSAKTNVCISWAEPLLRDASRVPMRGAEQRRNAGGSRLALFEPQASLASRPAFRVAQGTPKGRRPWGRLLFGYFFLAKQEKVRSPARRKTALDKPPLIHQRKNPTTYTPATRLAGNFAANRLPTPGVLLISSCAWCRLSECLTIARPSPVPPASRERPRSTR